MPTRRGPARKRFRATIRIPQTLYEEVRTAVRGKSTAAENINEFILLALRAYMRMLERRRTDRAFRGMADDRDFQKGALAIAEEFSESDWEAFELGEVHGAGAKA